jgi:hypothetical protein
MATLPQPLPAGKSTPLMLTTHACPCCRTPLQRWSLSIYQAPAQVYWCASCRRPVCLEPPAVPGRPAVAGAEVPRG